MTPGMHRLLMLARRRGACVEIIPDDAFEHRRLALCLVLFVMADVGIDLRRRSVVMGESSLATLNPGVLVHELGHLHATRRPLLNAHETEWLGWELAVAREAGVYRSWIVEQSDYGLEDDRCLGDLAPDELRAEWRDRTAAAKRRGIVDQHGRAVWLSRGRTSNLVADWRYGP